jgi:hypothetical protein
MKKLRCKKEYGVWLYKKVVDADLDAPIYELYNQNEMWVDDFGSYGDMKHYVETGEYL